MIPEIDVTSIEPVFFDIETDGLLRETTRAHVLAIRDRGEATVWRRESVAAGVEYLAQAVEAGRMICGHNVLGFDLPALRKLFPEQAHRLPDSAALDTLVLSRLIHPDIGQEDAVRLRRRGSMFPPAMYGRHSLEAWGHRLGSYKGDFAGPWDEWTQEMEDYCRQDVVVTENLYRAFVKKNPAPKSVGIEHVVRSIIARQERNGVGFDEEAAQALAARLQGRREALRAQLAGTIPPMVWPDGRKERIPKRDNRKLGYTAGATFCPVKVREFSPSSHDHIRRYLRQRYGWIPTEFTDNGAPKLDDATLSGLDYPDVALLREYLLISKRLGQISEGKEAWLRHSRNGVIFGSVVTNGAVTGRMTHSTPNLAQVPKVGSAYGEECRRLFRPTRDIRFVQLGCDASGLELRMLGHFMARYDDGAYAHAVVHGKSEDETDVHSLNTKALGLEPKARYEISGKQQKGRDCGKTFIYAYLYGAGDEKIGRIVGKSAAHGKKLKARFLAQTPALKSLKDAVQHAAKTRGWIRGLDGRIVPIRSAHAALNTLLQGGGAIVMKVALIVFDRSLQEAGLRPGVDYEFMLNVHDEFQLEVHHEHADRAGRLAVQAIREAGRILGLRCPLDGEYKAGHTWADTH